MQLGKALAKELASQRSVSLAVGRVFESPAAGVRELIIPLRRFPF